MRQNGKILPFLLLLLLLLLFSSGCSKEESSSAIIRAENAVSHGQQPDIAELQKSDSGIIAWLYIPGLNINAPIRQEDDSGLFIQTEYNNRDFSDRATLIYGPVSSDGKLFGSLQHSYSEDGSLDHYSEIVVFLPEQMLTYRVFAAGSFDDRHLMHSYHSLVDIADIQSMINDIQTYHTMSNQFPQNVELTEHDSLLILSCHAAQSEDQRFLVLARLVDRTG